LLILIDCNALEVIFNEMRYINLRFTYLLTYLLTAASRGLLLAIARGHLVLLAAFCKVEYLTIGMRLQPLWSLPARRYASADLCDSDVSVRPSVCLFVRLSITRRYCA